MIIKNSRAEILNLDSLCWMRSYTPTLWAKASRYSLDTKTSRSVLRQKQISIHERTYFPRNSKLH
jgi:hypothetical protein